MRTYFKFLSKNKFYTFVTVFGFAFSLMFVFLITVYTIQELSVDNFHEKGDRIYLLSSEKGIGTAYRLVDHLEGKYPEIEDMVAMTTSQGNGPARVNGASLHTKTIMAEENFFDIFSFSLISGDREQVLATRNSAVISETYARKAFPGKNPMGESITYHDSLVVTVSGIMKDIKNSAMPYADVIIRMENVRYFNSSMDDMHLSNAGSAIIAILAKKGADLKAKEADMAAFFKEFFWRYEMGESEKVIFIPWQDYYFSKVESYDSLKQGDKSFVIIFLTVGIIILLFALFNYLNLTIAQTGLRAKEMATRRLIGADSREPFFRMIFESVLLTFVSLLIGIFLAYLFSPIAEKLLQTKLYLNDFLSFGNIILILFSTVFLGFIAGLLPAIRISQAKPIEVIKGSFQLKTKMEFSKIFIVIQNIITIILIAASIIMYKQVNYMVNAPIGYNYKNMLFMTSNIFRDRPDMIQFGDELKQSPAVKRVGFSQGIPYQGGNNNTFEHNGNVISMWTIQGDSTFFNMLGFEVLFENNMGYNHKNYLNEQAYRELGLADDTLSIPPWGWHLSGKLKDFKKGNILQNTPPMLMVERSHNDYYPWNIVIEIQGDQMEAYNQIKTVYEKSHDLSFEGRYMEDMIEKSFTAQKRLLQIIMVFCGIAVLISILGLVAISTYFIQQRIREISLRKVFGSTNSQVLEKLVYAFLSYVLIAFIIAVPIIYYCMQNWLNNYSYRISLNPLYFIVAGLFCLCIAALAVFYQSYKAATVNPVEALKNE